MSNGPEQALSADANGNAKEVRSHTRTSQPSNSDIDELSQLLSSNLSSGAECSDNALNCDTQSIVSEFQKKLDHSSNIISEKQNALDKLKQQYNELMIRCQTTEKKNEKLLQEIEEMKRETGKSSQSSQYHPGGDICTSPKPDDKFSDSLAEKDKLIAELQSDLMGYYKMVMQTTKEKETLLSDKENLARTLDGAVRERDKLQAKLSDLESFHESGKLSEDTKSASQHGVPASDVDRFKSLVVELQGRNKQLQRQISNDERHIREQEEKIEKLTVRCGLAEKSHDSTDRSCDFAMQKSLKEKDEKISNLQAQISADNTAIVQLKKEIEELRSTTDPDTLHFREQIKAFQDDYFAERNEKQSLLQESQRLQEDNANLRRELDRAHYIPPTNRTIQPRNFGIPAQSPPIQNHPPTLDYSTHTQRPHSYVASRSQSGQGEFSNSQHYHQVMRGPTTYGNTIPPRNYPYEGGTVPPFYPTDGNNFYQPHPSYNPDTVHPSFLNRNMTSDPPSNRSNQPHPPSRNMQK